MQHGSVLDASQVMGKPAWPAIEESWETTQQSLNATIDIVLRMGWSDRRWLPSANALLPVAYFASLNGGHIAKDDEREVVRFLCLAAWTGAFSSASETAINRYLGRLGNAGRDSSAKALTDAIPKARLESGRKRTFWPSPR